MYDHVLDPLGDVVLKLEKPNAPFAVWQRSTPPPGPPLTAEPAATAATGAAPATAEPPVATGEGPAVAHKPVTFLVSSRHLILASPVLKTALTGGWSESTAPETDGPREIRTEGWDVEAMVVVMSIIHHKWPDVPLEVDLEQLAKIAVVVDYYRTHEIGHFMGALWIKRLRKTFSFSYGRNIALWLCISSVFRDAEIFRHSTKVAIKQCPSLRDLETLELPIPPPVVDAINNRRTTVAQEITTCLTDLQRKFLSGQGGCNSACRALQLGTLMQKMHSLKLLDRDSGQPLQDGMSLSELIRLVRGIELPTWYGNSRGCLGSDGDKSFLGRCPCCSQPHRCTKSPNPRAPPNPGPFGTAPPSSSGAAGGGGFFGTRPPPTPFSFGNPPTPAPAPAGSIFGNTSSKAPPGEPSVEGLSELKQCVHTCVMTAEREMEGLELSKFP